VQSTGVIVSRVCSRLSHSSPILFSKRAVKNSAIQRILAEDCQAELQPAPADRARSIPADGGPRLNAHLETTGLASFLPRTLARTDDCAVY
jgi:hypothetical protein